MVICLITRVQAQLEYEKNTPFVKKLLPLFEEQNPTELEENKVETVKVNNKTRQKTYIYRPGTAFKLVVTKERVPYIKPDKSVFAVISLRVTPDYLATSQVVYAKRPYKFDRLSWAIKTGWNEVIPFFSRLKEFKKYLKPFNEPVYGHFYIMGVREYPEYPGQYYHWPREALEDYYLYMLEKIDSVSSQN